MLFLIMCRNIFLLLLVFYHNPLVLSLILIKLERFVIYPRNAPVTLSSFESLYIPSPSLSSYPQHIYHHRSKYNSQLHFSPIANDAIVAVSTSAVACAWLQLWIKLAAAEVIAPTLSRKIIHCTSAPIYMCTWPLYAATDGSSRLIAAIVPFIQVLRLVLAGLREQSDDVSSRLQQSADVEVCIPNRRKESLAFAISRSGKSKEALQGPLIYAIGLLLATLFFFRESSIGVVAISQMAAGDGVADIIGRRYGSIKWPFSRDKSYIGSLAFVIGGWIASVLLLALLHAAGCLHMIDGISIDLMIKLMVISILCAGVELVTLGDDNVNVPIAGGILAAVLVQPLLRLM